MSTKWPHSSLFGCCLFVFAKYVSSDLVLSENFGLLVPLLLYPPSIIVFEFVLDGDGDDDEEVVSDADPQELDDAVRDLTQHDRLIVFRLDEE